MSTRGGVKPTIWPRPVARGLGKITRILVVSIPALYLLTAPAAADTPLGTTIRNYAVAIYDGGISVSNPADVVLGFSDVPLDHWAYAEIMACVSAGIVAGYPDGSYRPTLPVSRDQMAVFISRGLTGGDQHMPTAPAEASFPDVLPDHWAFQYIEYVHACGIAAGYPDGLYHPDYVVNRGQMAVFVARAMAILTGGADLETFNPPTTPTFPDVQPDGDWAWCYLYVEYVACEGVTNGYDDGLYHPERVVTRDQMAVYIARALGLAER